MWVEEWVWILFCFVGGGGDYEVCLDECVYDLVDWEDCGDFDCILFECVVVWCEE